MPFTVTVAPITGPKLSVTVPVTSITFFCCAISWPVEKEIVSISVEKAACPTDNVAANSHILQGIFIELTRLFIHF